MIYVINRFLCRAIKINKSKTIQRIKSRNCDVKEIKERRHFSKFQVCVFPQTLLIFVEMFHRNLQSPVWSRHIGVPPWYWPTWRSENVFIWNVLWLSRRLIICTEQRSNYMSTFPNALTSKKVINHKISIYFSINAIVASCHETP